MDNRVLKYFIFVLAFIFFTFWFVYDKSLSTSQEKLKEDVEYNPPKIKTTIKKETPPQIADKVEFKNIETEPVNVPEVKLDNEIKEFEEEKPNFCKTNVQNCLSCQNPDNPSSSINCNDFLRDYEQKNVFNRITSNPSFIEYLSVYHPNIDIGRFTLEDLKGLIQHYGQLTNMKEDEVFFYFGVEKENVIFCYTEQKNCL